MRDSMQMFEMQRRRLTLAMSEVAATGGLEAATVGRICARAGVSRRTFYELFADREACLLAVLEYAERRVRELLASGDRPRSWGERIRVALTVILEQIDADPRTAHVCLVEAPRASRTVQEYRRRALEELAAAVDEGRAEAPARSQPPSPLTAQGVVGGALTVIQERLIADDGALAREPFVGLVGPLMAMIVQPYLGAAAAKHELDFDPPPRPGRAAPDDVGPFAGLPIRFTYRTARVLATIAAEPGASNRHIADTSGIADQGQISRLLHRLDRSGLIENRGHGAHSRGEPNAWKLTERGAAIHAAIGVGVGAEPVGSRD